MTVSRLLSVFASSIAIVACIDSPSFVLDETTTSSSPTAPVAGEGDDEMVLIPATTFATAGTLAPAAPGSGEGEGGKPRDPGKGKGGGGGDDGKEGEGGGGVGENDAGAPAPGSGTTTVPAFWLDTREVSAAAYAACVRAGACRAAGTEPGCTTAPELGAHPQNCVTIDHARAFCTWRGKRLVRNDEWTAASAGAQLRPYPWGTEAPSAKRLNACGAAECGAHSMYPEGDGWVQTAPRGSFADGRSPEGVWDLAGNVAEWIDLAGAGVTRGGSFADHDVASVSALGLRSQNGASITVGFRCAKDG